jgi:hypothetical protein
MGGAGCCMGVAWVLHGVAWCCMGVAWVLHGCCMVSHVVELHGDERKFTAACMFRHACFGPVIVFSGFVIIFWSHLAENPASWLQNPAPHAEKEITVLDAG